MGNLMCPGQDMRFWRPGDIAEVQCGNCGAALEFFKDEARRKCRSCGNIVANPKISMGCAQWCEHAKECLGFDPKEVLDKDEPDQSMLERLTAAMKAVFKDDRKRILHALSVLDAAKEILKKEKADPRVVIAAAILHDIGIKKAEQVHGSNAGVYQEKEGPPIAKEILDDLRFDPEAAEHVLKIIANHHSARDIDTPEFRIIWDADHLINIPEDYPHLSGKHLESKIDRIFRTDGGREMAKKYIVDSR